MAEETRTCKFISTQCLLEKSHHSLLHTREKNIFGIYVFAFYTDVNFMNCMWINTTWDISTHFKYLSRWLAGKEMRLNKHHLLRWEPYLEILKSGADERADWFSVLELPSHDHAVATRQATRRQQLICFHGYGSLRWYRKVWTRRRGHRTIPGALLQIKWWLEPDSHARDVMQ